MELAVRKNKRKNYKLFISHAWRQEVTGNGQLSSPYIRIKKLLNREKGFYWQDLSITRDNPVAGPYRVKKVEAEVIDRINNSDVFILSEAGIYSGSRLWFEREFEIALTKLSKPKPILIIKPLSTKFFSGSYASGADAWAVWTQSSIIDGIRCLKNLTHARRKQLLAKGKQCNNCKAGVPGLELNRLKGVYCLNCGEVLYLLSGQKPDQTWPDRSKVFWSNDKVHEAWATSPKIRSAKYKDCTQQG